MRRYWMTVLLLASGLAARGETVYFLVSDTSLAHFDSYVLPLSDPAAIQHARDLVAMGDVAGETIVFANIAPGSAGVNRNYLSPGAPFWSWHVSNFIGFADFGAEIYDGWPGYVEENLEEWLVAPGPTIGFWNYTVTAELTHIPEVSGLTMLALGTGLGGACFLVRRHRIRRVYERYTTIFEQPPRREYAERPQNDA